MAMVAMDNISAFLIVCFVGFLAFPAEAAVKNYQFDREIQLEFQKEDGLLSDSELIIQVLGLCINCHMELHTLWGLNMAFVVKNGKSTEESVLRRIFHPAK
ncbi:hypothetical protein Q3G72_012927 [Acer saccharum]|nr:hypothetical protein Q3G72_012927 [Acer saccharum]